MRPMEEICQDHAQTVFKYLMTLSHDAQLSEELTQETFYQAIRSIGRFNHNCKLTTWLCAIAAVIVFVWINTFFIGKRVDNSDLIKAEVTVTNKHIVITGNLTDSGKDVSRVKFENEDGIVKVSVFETLKSSFNTNEFYESYVQNNDGTWICGGITYKYRVVLTGRDLNARKDGRFVVLTNEEDVTYDEVSRSMLSGNANAWLDPEKTVIVEIGGN